MASRPQHDETPNGCLRDHSAHHAPRTPATPHHQHERNPSPLSDDPPPLAGVQLVRPRRCAAAGAPTGPLPHGDVTRAAARKIPKNNQASPTTRRNVTRPGPHALLTTATPMGAAERGVWPVLVLMCCEETCSACCSPTSPGTYTARVKHVRHRVPGDRRHGGLGQAGHRVAQPARGGRRDRRRSSSMAGLVTIDFRHRSAWGGPV
jgi:hypothetical protein